jgi:hypothetical protein
VKQTLGAPSCIAIIAGAALSLAALPAPAQSLGGSSWQNCQTVNGRLVCPQRDRSAGGAGNRAYDRWDNGSPAAGSGSSSQHQFPYNVGSYHTWYGFGR